MAHQSSTDIAWNAVQKFRLLVPSLEAFAEAITGKKVHVTTSKDKQVPSYTDGKTIYLTPPGSFGIDVEHDRFFCGQREANGVAICEGCRSRELVFTLLCHEIAHIHFGSFDTLKNSTHRERSNSAESFSKLWGRIVYNAVEDIRVNNAMFNAQPGLWPMWQGMITTEIKSMNLGSIPANSQAIVGIALTGDGIDFDEGFLTPEVERLIQDEEIRELIYSASHASDGQASLSITKSLLKAAKNHGFFKDEEDEESDGDDGNQSEQSEKPENETTDYKQQGMENSGVPSDSSESEVDNEESSDQSEPQSKSSSNGESGEEDDESNSEGMPEGDSSGEKDEAESQEEEGESEGENALDEQGESSSETDAEDEVSSDDEENNEGDEKGEGENGDEQESDSVSQEGSDDFSADGTPEEAEEAISKIYSHPISHDPKSQEPSRALRKAIEQAEIFESPSSVLAGIEYARYDGRLWIFSERHISPDLMKPPTLEEMSARDKALTHARIVFSENKRAKIQRNLKSGKINTRALGARAPFNDERIFRKKTFPGKRSYSVLILMDISGSTAQHAGGMSRVTLEKLTVLLQAQLLNKLGVEFAVAAHSTSQVRYTGEFNLGICMIKDFHEPWTKQSEEKLSALGSFSENLDGHMVEWGRKFLQSTRSNYKIMLYFTDGAFPAANAEEERVVLNRELRTMKQLGIVMAGVGIGTDSPSRLGLPTVRLDAGRDIPNVIKHLEKLMEE